MKRARDGEAMINRRLAAKWRKDKEVQEKVGKYVQKMQKVEHRQKIQNSTQKEAVHSSKRKQKMC